MPDYYIEAEYNDGYVYQQDSVDESSFVAGKNVFYDILNKLPEAEHGKMVRFSLITPDAQYDVDWKGLPDNARPIRFTDYEVDFNVSGQESPPVPRVAGIDFGYQYTDEEGRNVQEIERVT